ncbi:hypothetical protein GCM10009837_49330 [Streptomyces durmitorensis]|uniref:CsbD family protein n=1 Tax=Streptomyces durmitorensis TaxID=319947 RepID=A0ABY4PYK2_9ACTN|nr:hypothetical protein [Streptomyces durmitorensis]UQT58026.1 hypothetical protein M4V62_24675 [Streptomyces durmitorensis]
MGIKDQFQDKANDLSAKAKGAMGGEKDEASERASQARDDAQERGSQAQEQARERSAKSPDDAQRAAREQQDKFNQDYDA